MTKIITKTNTVFTSGGLATLAIKSGATTLESAVAFDDSSYTGVADHSSATPVEVAAASNLTVEVATADLTDGKVTIYVHFDKPSLDA